MTQLLSNQSLSPEIFSSRQFLEWLHLEQISLAFTTYQTSRLCLIGVNAEGQLSGFERLFDRAMGLYATSDRLYLSTKYQLWQLDNALAPGELYNGYDKLYIPRIGYTTGDLDIHDVAVTEPPLGGQGGIVFVSTLLNCLATVSEKKSCTPLWKPNFISKIVNEDRCHLNGLAMVEGQPRFVTACSRSDVVDGWRDKRRDGGVVIDVPTNEIILSGLSMPHSPRFYQGKLWLHNSGSGEFGYIDLQAGKFEPVTFCPGYLRGLAFCKNFAIVGLSKPRNQDKTFSGLSLDEKLIAKDTEPRCGLMVIDLNSGNIIHWLRLEGSISELYDVQVLPNVKTPMALGFQTEEISQFITLDLDRFQVQSSESTNTNTVIPEIESKYDRAFQLQNQNQLEQAVAEYQQIITKCEYAPAYHQLGNICLMQEQFAEAIPYYQQAIALEPNRYRTWHNLGVAYQNLLQIDAAVAAYQQALKINPNYSEVYEKLGVIFRDKEQWEPAKVAFEQLLKLKPESSLAFSYLAFMRSGTCDWNSYETDLKILKQQTQKQLENNQPTDVAPFTSLSLPWTAKQHLQIAQSHAGEIARKWQEIQHSLICQHPKTLEGRLRIGYVCADFRDHALSHLMQGLFALHDRQEFEIFSYSIGPDDGSEYRRRIATDSEHFIDIADLSTLEAARRINANQPHILVKINPYTRLSRTQILVWRPAPIQVSYFYPGSLGADFVDYLISDAVVTPSEQRNDFSEKLAILPNSYMVTDNQQPISPNPITRSQCGLPETGFVFCCFNQPYKIEPKIFNVWMQILSQVPGSVLWLFSNGIPTENNLRREAASRGVDPNRLIFANYIPKAEHLARLQLADLILDTYYYNAHTTTCDALWVGVPVLTCPGKTYAARVAASLLTAIGLPELIVNDLENYAQKAVQLAQSPEELQMLKRKLLHHRTTYPLFDTPRFVRNLEQAYRQMWANYAAGNSPQEIIIQESL